MLLQNWTFASNSINKAAAYLSVHRRTKQRNCIAIPTLEKQKQAILLPQYKFGTAHIIRILLTRLISWRTFILKPEIVQYKCFSGIHVRLQLSHAHNRRKRKNRMSYCTARYSEYLTQNTNLLFNESAICFGYCLVAIIRPIPRIQKYEIIRFQYCSETSELTRVLYKVHNVYNRGKRRITTFRSTTGRI